MTLRTAVQVQAQAQVLVLVLVWVLVRVLSFRAEVQPAKLQSRVDRQLHVPALPRP